MRKVKIAEVVDGLIADTGDEFDAVCVVAVKGGKSGVAYAMAPGSMGAAVLVSGMQDTLARDLKNEVELAGGLRGIGIIEGKTEKATMIIKDDTGEVGRIDLKPGEKADPIADVFKAALGSGFEAYLKGMRERAGL